MKKQINFGPLQLDKKTIAKLDNEQLEKIKGGSVITDPSTGTQPGTTVCPGKNSCKTGGSTCYAGSLSELDE